MLPARCFLYSVCASIVSLRRFLWHMLAIFFRWCTILIYTYSTATQFVVEGRFPRSHDEARTLTLVQKRSWVRDTHPVQLSCILFGSTYLCRPIFRIPSCCRWLWRSFWNHFDPHVCPNPRYPVHLCLVTLLWPSPGLVSNDLYSIRSIFWICHQCQHIFVQLFWIERYSSCQCNRTLSHWHL